MFTILMLNLYVCVVMRVAIATMRIKAPLPHNPDAMRDDEFEMFTLPENHDREINPKPTKPKQTKF